MPSLVAEGLQAGGLRIAQVASKVAEDSAMIDTNGLSIEAAIKDRRG
ncbi:hypothetical protein PXK00_09975 [Phaeobacter sp. QD34_3]|nr:MULTISPECIES: hypothetical protein [unclassified Phaeobacter]MDE4133440.1 hypothetical protein [Phaeobacter sp. QD34_3]MDE4137076.1 hypothetical protein [Phaeobacter sp. QD34_24]